MFVSTFDSLKTATTSAYKRQESRPFGEISDSLCIILSTEVQTNWKLESVT